MQKDDNPTDTHTEKLEGAWERTKSNVKELLGWSKRISNVGKLKLDLVRFLKQRKRAYQELGSRVYTLMKEGRFSPHEIQEIIQQIDGLNNQIELQNKAIEEASQKTTKDSGLF